MIDLDFNQLFDPNQLPWNVSNDIILEIGSQREHGSTAWLCQMAQRVGVDLYSIDVVPDARDAWSGPPVNFVVAESGSEWCQKHLPGLGRNIRVLLLDNYDWNYEVLRPFAKQHFDAVKHRDWPDCDSWQAFYQLPEWIQLECQNLHGFDLRRTRPRAYYREQADWYLQRGITVNNRDCVKEHLTQMLACLPYMCQDSVIICDDTFVSPEHDCWAGKCAAVVPLIEAYGYQCINQQAKGAAWRRRAQEIT